MFRYRQEFLSTCLVLTFEDSEIYQVTGPVERFAGQIASQGFVVGESE